MKNRVLCKKKNGFCVRKNTRFYVRKPGVAHKSRVSCVWRIVVSNGNKRHLRCDWLVGDVFVVCVDKQACFSCETVRGFPTNQGCAAVQTTTIPDSPEVIGCVRRITTSAGLAQPRRGG